MNPSGFQTQDLGGSRPYEIGQLPDELSPKAPSIAAAVSTLTPNSQ